MRVRVVSTTPLISLQHPPRGPSCPGDMRLLPRMRRTDKNGISHFAAHPLGALWSWSVVKMNTSSGFGFEATQNG